MDDGDEPVSQLYMQTCCICVPLRLGVLLVATATFLFSSLYVIDRGDWLNSFRQYVGGYALESSLALTVLEISGTVFGLLGIWGAYFCRPQYVEVYNWWQLARILEMFFMYYIDLPLIWNCEAWAGDIKGTTNKYRFNEYLYQVSVNGECTTERSGFLVHSVILLLAFMYAAWVTSRFHSYMTRLPKQLLRVPKDPTSGAFYAHSLGERVALNGEWGADGEWGDRERQPLLPAPGPLMFPPGPPGPFPSYGPIAPRPAPV